MINDSQSLPNDRVSLYPTLMESDILHSGGTVIALNPNLGTLEITQQRLVSRNVVAQDSSPLRYYPQEGGEITLANNVL